MDAVGGGVGEPNTALVVLAFLQRDCKNADYRKEILSLSHDLSLSLEWVTDFRLDDGDLESDGHLPSCITVSRDDIRATVGLQRPDAAAVQQVAQELKEIADQLELRVVAQATQNLRRNILSSSVDKWEEHLSLEVARVMRENVTLKDLAQEQVTMALTLTLVKTVCEETPPLLRSLFNTTLRFVSHARAE